MGKVGSWRVVLAEVWGMNGAGWGETGKGNQHLWKP